MNSTHEEISKYMITRFYDAVPFCGNVMEFSKENPEYNEAEVKALINNFANRHSKTLPTNIVSNEIYLYSKEEIIQEIISFVGGDFTALYITNLERYPISIPYHCIYNESKQYFTYFTYIVNNGKIINDQELTKEEASMIRDKLMDKEYIKNYILESLDTNMLLNISCAGFDFTIRFIDSIEKYVMVNSISNGSKNHSNKLKF